MNQDQRLKELERKIKQATGVAFRYAQTEGSHHRLWVIEEMLRELLGSEGFEDFVNNYENDDDYEWEEGVAP